MPRKRLALHAVRVGSNVLADAAPRRIRPLPRCARENVASKLGPRTDLRSAVAPSGDLFVSRSRSVWRRARRNLEVVERRALRALLRGIHRVLFATRST